MGTSIKYYALSDVVGLKEHIRASEAQIDALSDEELDHAEAYHQLEIAAFFPSKNRSQLPLKHSKYLLSIFRSIWEKS